MTNLWIFNRSVERLLEALTDEDSMESGLWDRFRSVIDNFLYVEGARETEKEVEKTLQETTNYFKIRMKQKGFEVNLP